VSFDVIRSRIRKRISPSCLKNSPFPFPLCPRLLVSQTNSRKQADTLPQTMSHLPQETRHGSFNIAITLRFDDDAEYWIVKINVNKGSEEKLRCVVAALIFLQRNWCGPTTRIHDYSLTAENVPETPYYIMMDKVASMTLWELRMGLIETVCIAHQRT